MWKVMSFTVFGISKRSGRFKGKKGSSIYYVHFWHIYYTIFLLSSYNGLGNIVKHNYKHNQVVLCYAGEYSQVPVLLEFIIYGEKKYWIRGTCGIGI